MLKSALYGIGNAWCYMDDLISDLELLNRALYAGSTQTHRLVSKRCHLGSGRNVPISCGYIVCYDCSQCQLAPASFWFSGMDWTSWFIRALVHAHTGLDEPELLRTPHRLSHPRGYGSGGAICRQPLTEDDDA